jgi:hypothetical protein
MDGYFRFSCPHCDRSIKCLPVHTGRQARCPKCGKTVVPLPKAHRAHAPDPLPLPAPVPVVKVPRPAAAARASEGGERSAVNHPRRERSDDEAFPWAQLADGRAERTQESAGEAHGGRGGESLPLLSLARAKEVGTDVAQRHDGKQTLERFARLDTRLVAAARREFARQMEPDETPLALFDRSPRKDGTAGTMITNRRVYSTFLDRPIPLADILLAHVERPSQLQEIMTGVQVVIRTLLVNGTPVMVGSDKFALLADLLTELGRAVREEHGLTWVPPEGAPGDDPLTRAAAAWVCDRRPEREIVVALAAAGMPERQADETVDGLAAIRYRRQYVLPWVLILLGFPLLLFGAFMLLAGSDENMYGRIWGGGVGVFLGVALPGIGIYRLISGKTPWRTHELLAAWRGFATRRRSG